MVSLKNPLSSCWPTGPSHQPWCWWNCRELQNIWGWERPLISVSPTVNPNLFILMEFQLEIPTKVHQLSPTDANNFFGDGLKSCIYKWCAIPPAKPTGANRGRPCAGEAPLGNCSSKIKMQMFISTSLSGLSAGESSFTNSKSIASLEKSRHCFVSKSRSLFHTAAVEVLTRKRLLFKHLGGSIDWESFPVCRGQALAAFLAGITGGFRH